MKSSYLYVIYWQGDEIFLDNQKTESCPFCGYSVNVDDAFCNSCGASLKEQKDVSPSTTHVIQHTSQLVTPHQQTVFIDKPGEKRNIIAIVSLALGILCIIFSLIPFTCCVSMFMCVPTLITGIIGLITPRNRGFAIGGLSCMGVAIILFSLQLSGVFYLY